MVVTSEDILGFWFGGHDPDQAATGQAQSGLWWGHDEKTDAQLRERFSATHRAAAAGDLDDWAKTPQGRLALVLVLDQLSRNLHRGTPQAFALDAKAQQLTLDALARGEDRDLPLFWRVFLYMPLMHAEDLRLQERACQVFDQLASSCEGERRAAARNNLDFAYRHRDIVARFGRFPHRNAIVGRVSSPEELRFLEQPGSSF